MKATISAISIIAIIILACIYMTAYTVSFCDDMCYMLDQSMMYAENGEWETASYFFNSASQIYENSENRLHTFISHNLLDDICDMLSRIESSIQLKDSVSYMTETNCLSGYIRRLATSDILNPANLF